MSIRNRSQVSVFSGRDGQETGPTTTKPSFLQGKWHEHSLTTAGIVWTDNRNGNLDIYFATVGNAPAVPSRPDGPTSVRTNRKATYASVTTDPNGDQIYYLFDWGDGTDSGWVGPFESGIEVVLKQGCEKCN